MLLSQKLTLFFVLCGLIILIGTPVSIYNLIQGRTDGIVGAYLLVAVVIALVLLVLDRFSLRFADARLVSIIEGGLLLVGIIWYNYGSRTTTIDLTDYKSPYFALVWTTKPQLAEKLHYRFPFDKVIRVDDRPYICLDKREFLRQEFELPTQWHGGFRSKGFEINSPDYESIYIYQTTESPDFSDEQLEQIKDQVMKKLTANQ